MKERGRLFRGEMVRAILDGTKTQTRRTDGLPPPDWRYEGTVDGKHRFMLGAEHIDLAAPHEVGSRIWVRETWMLADREPFGGQAGYGVAWRATHPKPEDGVEWIDGPVDYGYPESPASPVLVPTDGKWRPGIHMPRWASRLTLDVTGIRVERLHDISEEDARAEGVEPRVTANVPERVVSHTLAFADLWRSINGAESWAASPWVWVVGFRVTP